MTKSILNCENGMKDQQGQIKAFLTNFIPEIWHYWFLPMNLSQIGVSGCKFVQINFDKKLTSYISEIFF